MTDERTAARIAARAAAFRDWCVQNGIAVLAGDAVDAAAAASILGLAEHTLANKRAEGDGPDYFRRGGRGRVLYDLADLAAWVEAGRTEKLSPVNSANVPGNPERSRDVLSARNRVTHSRRSKRRGGA